MGTVVNIILVMMIVGLLVALLLMKFASFEQSVNRIADSAEQAIKQAQLAHHDAIQAQEKANLATHTANVSKESFDQQVAYWNYKTEEIEQKLMKIVNSIQKMDEIDRIAREARAQSADIAKRYVLYKDPVKGNGGVEWASDYETGEE